MNEKKQQGKYGTRPPAKWRQLKRRKAPLAFQMFLLLTLLNSMLANAQWTLVGTSCAGTLTNLNTTNYLGTSGSYSNTSTDDKTKAFDGDVNTYFDAPSGAVDNVWVGMDLGAVRQISCVRVRPRNGWSSRMVGGKFQVSNDSTFTNPRTIYTVQSGEMTNFADYYLRDSSSTGTQARYFRYYSPDFSWGNVAEITVYGSNPPPPTAPSTDWLFHASTAGFKIIGTSGTMGITVDSIGQLITDTNIIAHNIYGHSFSYQYDEVIPDYVFDTDYSLMPLNAVEAYVKKYKHLPDVPSDLEYKERGAIDMKEIDLLLLRKVEELTLHLIEQDKRTKELEAKNSRLRHRVERKN